MIATETVPAATAPSLNARASSHGEKRHLRDVARGVAIVAGATVATATVIRYRNTQHTDPVHFETATVDRGPIGAKVTATAPFRRWLRSMSAHRCQEESKSSSSTSARRFAGVKWYATLESVIFSRIGDASASQLPRSKGRRRQGSCPGAPGKETAHADRGPHQRRACVARRPRCGRSRSERGVGVTHLGRSQRCSGASRAGTSPAQPSVHLDRLSNRRCRHFP